MFQAGKWVKAHKQKKWGIQKNEYAAKLFMLPIFGYCFQNVLFDNANYLMFEVEAWCHFENYYYNMWRKKQILLPTYNI